MKPLFVGYGEDGKPLALTEGDLETHVHGVGASRTGKSKLIEWIARELVRNQEGFCLIDPHGFLYWDLLRWLSYVQPRREILLLNPSSEGRVVGFNPFRAHEGDLSTQVDRRVLATVKAWGEEGTEETPRLARWLRCLYYALAEQGHSLDVARYFLSWSEQTMRRRLIAGIQDDFIRNEWLELVAYPRPQDFSLQVESTRNRLFQFLGSAPVRRIVALPSNSLDMREIIEGGKILLVNLQPSDRLSDESAKLLGTLLLNEILGVAKRREQRPGGRPPSRFFLIIDEFQEYLTRDVQRMLDGTSKYGLHLFLFHQHLSQLHRRDEEIAGAVMTNARIKFVFGGLTRADAREMVENLFPNQLDLKRVKHLVEQTKFWPVYERDKVFTRGRSGGSSTATSTGEAWDPALEEWVPTSSATTADNSSWQEGESDIPVSRTVPFKEVSNVEFYNLEEILWEMSDRLMEQYQRHFFLRRPGQKTQAAVTPFVKQWHVTEERLREYVAQLTERFPTPQEVDARIQLIHDDLKRLEVVEPLQLPEPKPRASRKKSTTDFKW